jgi:hypothetical protein
MRTTRILAGILGLTCLTMVGCGRGLAAKVMYGSVTCGGENVPGGRISFVPVDGQTPWECATPIVDGKYRIDARGGVPLGKYCVQVDARKKTGRKVQGFNGFEMGTIDEEVRLGPETYSNQHSPLVVEVSADSDGQFDIAIPRE